MHNIAHNNVNGNLSGYIPTTKQLQLGTLVLLVVAGCIAYKALAKK